MDERAMMAQKVESETDAGQTAAPGNTAIKEQVFEASAAIAAASSGILNPHAEAALAHQRRKTQAPHESTHGAKGITEKGDAAIDDKPVDAVGGHASADARFRFKDQGVEPAILEPERCAEPRDASADDDNV